MLIAQASDLHPRADPEHYSHARFKSLLRHLLTLNPVPEVLVLSGDLADDGDRKTYEHLRGALKEWPCEVRITAGNHGDRSKLLSVFPDAGDNNGFVQSVLHLGELRLVLVDTVQPGRSGGGFCSARAEWLHNRFAEAPASPALIFLHHPPVNLGLHWIDPGRGSRWAQLLGHTIVRFPIAGIGTGHVHVGAIAFWNGHRVMTCPSSVSDLSLNFAHMDPATPDRRPLMEKGEPGFALHRWHEGQLSTYFGRCPQRVTDRWEGSNELIIASMISERED